MELAGCWHQPALIPTWPVSRTVPSLGPTVSGCAWASGHHPLDPGRGVKLEWVEATFQGLTGACVCVLSRSRRLAGWWHGGPGAACTMEPKRAPPEPRRRGRAHSPRYLQPHAGQGCLVCVSSCCSDKLPTYWPKTTQMCPLRVLEVESGVGLAGLKARCGQRWAPQRLPGTPFPCLSGF